MGGLVDADPILKTNFLTMYGTSFVLTVYIIINEQHFSIQDRVCSQ